MTKKLSVREQMKTQAKGLHKRQEESQKNPDGRVYRSYSVVDEDKMQNGVKKFKDKLETNKFDVIPFLAGPNVKDHEEGKITQWLEIHVHQNIGLKEETHICPNLMWGDYCPGCHFIKKHGWDVTISKKDTIPILPKARTVMFVWPHNTTEQEADGLHYFDVANGYIREPLSKLLTTKGDAKLIFADLDEGKQIVYDKSMKGEFPVYAAHSFENRDYEIPDSVTDQIFSLDDTIDMHPDEEKLEKMWQIYFDNAEEGKSYVQEEDSNVTDDVIRDEEPEPEEEPLEERQEQELEEAFKSPPEPEKEEESEPEPEQESKQGGVVVGDCPSNYTYGKSLDMEVECGECEVYDDCGVENGKIKELAAQAREAAKESAPRKRLTTRRG